MILRLFLAALGSASFTAALSPAGDADTPTSVDPRNYTDAEGTLLQGYLALPKHLRYEHAGDHAHEIGAHEGEDHEHFEWPPSPAVIFIHDADGANEYEQQRATIVARDQGYVGFAADIFGVFAERPAPDAPWSERAPFLGQFLNNATLFDKATYDKLLKDAAGYKVITVSILSERLKINGSLARRGIRILQEKGAIRPVVGSGSQLIYTRNITGDDAEEE